jgi:hypothetical protein
LSTHAGQIQVKRGAQSGTKIIEVQPNEMWQLKGFSVNKIQEQFGMKHEMIHVSFVIFIKAIPVP